MQISLEQVNKLTKAFPLVQQLEEGGIPFFFIPNFTLPDGCTPSITNVLFCPVTFQGYNSRLYFSEKIQSNKANTQNWNFSGGRILERNWYAFSWRIPENLGFVQMIAAHLRGLV
jgi:hypothetical protein